jgi:hypothetical protein
MSAGPKQTPAKSVTPPHSQNISEQPGVVSGKVTAAHIDMPAKTGKQERKAEFGQATYYRQGVLVPGGPHKSVPRRTR